MVEFNDDIWIVSDQAATIEAVKQTLDAQTDHTLRQAASLQALGMVLANSEAGAAFIDIDRDPVGTLARLEPLITRYTQTRFIVLSSQFSNDLLLEAMNVGARHFVTKSTIEHELPRIIERILTTSGAATARKGSVLSVLSAGGGCGATTLAVNLAHELPHDPDQPALLIDLDNAYGAVASYLGMRGEYGLAEVLGHDARIDPQLITTTAQKYNERVHALINPVSVDMANPARLNYERLESAIQACRSAYAWTLIDAPRQSIDLSARLANVSRVTLIVCQLTVKDLRAARAIRTALIDRGVNQEAVRFVLNRCRSKHAMISPREAETALGDNRLMMIRNDYAAANECVNLGKPLAEAAPRSNARRDVRQIAELINQTTAAVALTPARPTPTREAPRVSPSYVG